MDEPDPAAQIADKARQLLANREHSRLELTRKLAARGFAADEIAVALDRLVAEGALNEARFIEQYINERAAKGFGPWRIRAALRDKGLPDAPVDRQLETIAEEEWAAYMADIYDRRFGSEPPPDRAEYARRGRFLEQRGFPSDMIRRFLRWPD